MENDDDQFLTRGEFRAERIFTGKEFGCLDNKIDRVVLELINVKMDVKEIKEKMASEMMTKADGQRILDHIDAWAQRFEVYDRKALTQDHRLLNLENQSANHETRITHLESHQDKF